MHYTTDPETKDQAEDGWLPYWGAKLFSQSTRDGIMAMHERRNSWLHPEMRRLYVVSEYPDQRTTYLWWIPIKALGESCQWLLDTSWKELSLPCTIDYLWALWSASVTQKTGTVIIKKLKRLFATHGIPNELLSDKGPPFYSAEFENFFGSSGTEDVTSSPGYPQSNGRVENAVKTAKSLIKTAKASGVDRLNSAKLILLREN